MDLLSQLWIDLTHSDVSGAEMSLPYIWGKALLAHFGLGALFAALPARFGWACLGLVVLKQAAFDIPNDAFALWTVADSLVDVAMVYAGLAYVQAQHYARAGLDRGPDRGLV
jgi:hypothetical protein